MDGEKSMWCWRCRRKVGFIQKMGGKICEVCRVLLTDESPHIKVLVEVEDDEDTA